MCSRLTQLLLSLSFKIQLRSTLDVILMNSARDLRLQADKVELALHERINEMNAVREKLEIDLKEVKINKSFLLN